MENDDMGTKDLRGYRPAISSSLITEKLSKGGDCKTRKRVRYLGMMKFIHTNMSEPRMYLRQREVTACRYD